MFTDIEKSGYFPDNRIVAIVEKVGNILRPSVEKRICRDKYKQSEYPLSRDSTRNNFDLRQIKSVDNLFGLGFNLLR